jgi:hypothetical protein
MCLDSLTNGERRPPARSFLRVKGGRYKVKFAIRHVAARRRAKKTEPLFEGGISYAG